VIQFLVLLMVGVLIFYAIGEDTKRILSRRVEGYRVKYSKYLTRDVVTPALVFVALALLMRDVILTPYLLAVAAGVVYFRVSQVMARVGGIRPRDISQMVIAFRAAYQLQPAAFKSLEMAATKVGDPLKSVLNTVVNIYFNTAQADLAFDEFRRRVGDHVLMKQFIYILEMSSSASNESMTTALDAFVGRLRRQDELQREVESSLSGITGQTSFMQALAIAIAFVMALVPSFRSVYTSLLGRIGYMFLMGVIMGASYMIEKQVISLKEEIL
jgi:hypothetical protein